jgi:conjugal transfer/type IV secretion protein DotA/TraY
MKYRFIWLAALLALTSSPAFADTSLPSLTDNSDPALQYMSQLFGSLFDSAGGGGGSSSTALSTYAGMLNTVVLAVAFLFFNYQLVVGTMQTAHDGEVLGKAWSSLWVPIRFLAAGLFMVPVGDYCAIQTMTASLVQASVNIAGWTYGQVMEQMVSGGVPLTAQLTPTYENLAGDVWQMAICRHTANLIAAEESGQSWPSDAALSPISRQTTDQQTFSWLPGAVSNKSGFSVASCGSLVLNFSKSQTYSDIRNAQITGLENLIVALDPLAQKVVAGARDGASSSDQAAIPTPGQIHTAVLAANRALANANTAAVARLNGNSAAAAKTVAAMKAGGWLWAGTWFNRIADMNGDYNGALNSLPVYLSSDSNPFRSTDGHAEIALKTRKVATALWEKQDTTALASWRPPPGTLYAAAPSAPVPGASQGDMSSKMGHLTGVIHEAFAKITTTINDALAGVWITKVVPNSVAADPLSALTSLGHSLVMLTSGVAISLGVTSALMSSTILGTGLGVTAFWATAGGNLINTLIMGLWAAGAFLAYVLPMMPYFIWMASVVGYFTLVVEAVIAGPLWAFAHLKAGGEGIHGQAGQGYMITLNLTLRPVLMIGGLISAATLMGVIVELVLSTFGAAASDSTTGSLSALTAASAVVTPIGAGIDIVTGIMFRIGLFVVVLAVVTERCFSLIYKMPDSVIRWIDGQGEQLGEDHTSQNIRAMALAIKQHGGGPRGGSARGQDESRRDPRQQTGQQSAMPQGQSGPAPVPNSEEPRTDFQST